MGTTDSTQLKTNYAEKPVNKISLMKSIRKSHYCKQTEKVIAGLTTRLSLIYGQDNDLGSDA